MSKGEAEKGTLGLSLSRSLRMIVNATPRGKKDDTVPRVTVQFSDDKWNCIGITVIPREYWENVLLPTLQAGSRSER